MGKSFPSLQQRAMALCALLAGDYDLEGLTGAGPSLANPVRAHARNLMNGPPETFMKRILAEKADLMRQSRERDLKSFWDAMPLNIRPIPGLEDLIFMYSSQNSLYLKLEAFFENENLALKLTSLSTALMRYGASGERWAVYLTAMGAAQLYQHIDMSPRLAPGIVWIGCSFERDDEEFEGMIKDWPEELKEGLDFVGMNLKTKILEKIAKTSSYLRNQLEREILHIG